jgi:hypothetical protein
MRQEKLLCHKRKFKPVTTDSTHGLPIYPNLLKGREITGLNQAWASDITYVQLQHTITVIGPRKIGDIAIHLFVNI